MLKLFALIALAWAGGLVFMQPDCSAVQDITGGEPLEWIGYENGGWALPADIEMTARVDFADGGVWEFAAESEPGVRYIWWFTSYEQTADVNGEHFGAHEFCAVKVVS